MKTVKEWFAELPKELEERAVKARILLMSGRKIVAVVSPQATVVVSGCTQKESLAEICEAISKIQLP